MIGPVLWLYWPDFRVISLRKVEFLLLLPFDESKPLQDIALKTAKLLVKTFSEQWEYKLINDRVK